MSYDFSIYESIEDLEDINILHTQLLSIIKEYVSEPFEDIYIVGSFCFNVGKSNDIDIIYCTSQKHEKINRKAVKYSKLLSSIFNKKIHFIVYQTSYFLSFMEKISNPPYFDLINLIWVNKQHGDVFNKKLYKKKWVTRSGYLE